MTGVLTRGRIALAALTLIAVSGCTAALGGASAACGLCDVARGKGDATTATALAATGADVVAMASELAAYGRRTNSPLALLTAAELLIGASPAQLDASKQTQGGATTAGTKTGAAVTLDPGQLIAAARAMSTFGGLEALATQLQNQANAPKGAVGGAVYRVDRVLSRSTDIWTLTFRGNERASIRVDGDGDTDLDCYVYDGNGRLVAYDNDYTDYCVLDWYPSFTSNHRLEIRNLGDVYNQYVLTTN